MTEKESPHYTPNIALKAKYALYFVDLAYQRRRLPEIAAAPADKARTATIRRSPATACTLEISITEAQPDSKNLPIVMPAFSLYRSLSCPAPKDSRLC